MKTILLLSGGMDSAALLWWKKPDIALTLDYGQLAAEAEIISSAKLCEYLKINHEVLRIDCHMLGSGDMAGQKINDNAPTSDWWPYRNQLLITFASMRAISFSLSIEYNKQKGKVERVVKYFKESFMPILPKKTGHSQINLNEQAMQWCDEVNHQEHMTTMEIPCDRLGSENFSPLPRIPYLEDTSVKVSKDGCVAFRGRVFNVDMRFAGTEGKIIDLEDTIFGYFDGKLVILGKRDLPVYVRHQYYHSKNTKKLKQKRSKHIHSNISRWLKGNLPKKISINWKLIYA